jgi:hypothetical protein
MDKKLFCVFSCLLVLFTSGGYAQIKKIKGAKFSKQKEIRQFDFLNAPYEAGCSGLKVRVKNGRYVPQDTADAFFSFDVAVSYGDLTGDGIEEVLVFLQCSGAVQNYDEGKIYKVKNHRLVKLTEIGVGTKNNGSIVDAKIKNGRIIVKRGPGPNLCTDISGAAEETAVFRFRRGKLRQVGKSICKVI